MPLLLCCFAKTDPCLLQAFHQLWQALLPDVVTGYNIFGFDEKYLWQRYQLHSLEDKLNFSKLVGYKSKLLDPELQVCTNPRVQKVALF